MDHYDGCREGYCWQCECSKEQCIEDKMCSEWKRWKKEKLAELAKKKLNIVYQIKKLKGK